MLALTVDAARNIAIGVLVALVVLAAVTAKVIANITAKVIVVLIIVGLALGVWTQRASLGDCADRVKEQARAGSTTTTCTFFGTDVDVKVPVSANR